MAYRSIFCILPSQAQAQRALNSLNALEFLTAEVSLFFQSRTVDGICVSSKTKPVLIRVKPEKSTPLAKGELRHTAGVVEVIIHGTASLFSAGPLATMLAETKPLDIASGLINFGVPAAEAGRYESLIKEGKVFLSVRSENPDKIDRARDVVVAEGAASTRTLMDVPLAKNVRRREYGLVRALLR